MEGFNPFDPASFIGVPSDLVKAKDLSYLLEDDDNGAAYEEAAYIMESLPDDFHNINLEDAVRLTPATLAFHVTRGLWWPATHLLFAAAEIARALLEGNAHIIFSMPARHGKSELASVWTPTWWLDLFPTDHIILATYAADLSQSFGRRVRDTIIELGGVDNNPAPEHKVAGRPRLRTTVRSDVQQVGHFQTPQGGGMTSVGIGGALTGRGANVLLIDDYVKNAKEAASHTTQKDIYEWFQSTAYTRLEPGGSVIILATRWDVNDLIGMILQNKGDFQGEWRVIELPAIAHSGEIDPIGRNPGEALWAERYPKNRLMQIKSVIGKYFWSAMYQQRPVKREDAKFDASLIELVAQTPYKSHLRWVRSWDLASSTTKKADYTVGTLMGADGPARSSRTNTFVEDVIRGRWGPGALEEKIAQVAESDGPEIPIIIEQEPGSSGKLHATYLKDTVLKGYNVAIKPPPSDKWLRAQPFMAAVGDGRLKARKASWNTAWIKELDDFPSGNNDDQVDSVSQGFNYLNDSKNVSASWGRKPNDSRHTRPSSGGFVSGATFGRR